MNQINVHEYPSDPSLVPAYRIAVMQAEANGQPIEIRHVTYRNSLTGPWLRCLSSPEWNWQSWDFRVAKPEPEPEPKGKGKLISLRRTLLSERARPNCEAAPWVIDEIKDLEREVKRLRQALWDVFRKLGGDTDGNPTPEAVVSDLVPIVMEVVDDARSIRDQHDAFISKIQSELKNL